LDNSGSVVSLCPDTFRRQMGWLSQSGRAVVPLDRIRETAGGVALTFDDGFRNFFQHAFPVLQKYSFPATVFVISKYCGGHNDWPTQSRGIPALELMRWSEVEQAARGGIRIGCHTATHPRLTLLSEAEIEGELTVSREALEERIGQTVDSFAYPYGDHSPRVRAVVGRHFRLGCSTRLAPVSPRGDLLDLPRLDIYYFRNQFWFEGLGRLHGRGYLAARQALRGIRQRLRPS
jgi:peptidoglycan/xylan/chitin deacetylase (PgdA/CDA1 family)